MTITISGLNNSGKTFLTMRIAALLQAEGVNVTVLSEPQHPNVVDRMMELPLDGSRIKDVTISDLGGYKFNFDSDEIIHFRGKKNDKKL